MTIKPETIDRDENGFWTHPDWPDLGEQLDCKYKLWASQNYIALETILMLETISLTSAEKWLDGTQSSFAHWIPKKPTPDSFLLSIHDTEDGPIAVFAVPAK